MIRAPRLVALLWVLWLAGCAAVPYDFPKSPSNALPANSDTDLGAAAQRWVDDHGEDSGFIGLSNGTEALGARLRMMELAEESIDAQYFLIKPDRAGALFVGGLLDAADRGVRVRFVVDDIFTPGLDRELTLLNSHPNIEIRLFNPIGNRKFKYGNYLLDFKRANRRMHNKSFTVDGAISIVGGRNIAEEYFELQQDVIFDDFEVLTVGPVVPEIAGSFDIFWNSELAVPIEAFGVSVNVGELNEFRQSMRELTESEDANAYTRAVNSPLIRRLMAGEVEPGLATATVVTDTPEKLQNAVGDRELATMARELSRRFDEAEREIVIITPYFVPRKSGMEVMEALIAKGTRIIVVTNSLASNNHLAVHSGYARYRKRMLEAGVELYEIKADEVGEIDETSDVRPEMLTLHSKASIIDRETIFVGSLNFDPRSLAINTEMGLFIESETIGPAFFDQVATGLSATTFKVVLDDDGDLKWVYDYDGRYEEYDKEPLTTWGQRFMVGFYRILPIEGQL